MDWKKIGKFLLQPPLWLLILLTVGCAALLASVFVKAWEQTPLAYGVYVLSFYTLCALVIFLIHVLPGRYQQLRSKIYGNPLGNRYMTDRAFRMKVSLYVSLSISLLYVGVNIWSWMFSHSWWFVVLAVYYTVLALMRFLLLRQTRSHSRRPASIAKWKSARLCACILLLVNLSLSGAVLMILYQHRGYDYPGVMIYVMALYTFYATTYAIVSLIRYRRLGNPILSMAKIVSLSAALVSMLNLETAMFSQFGAEMSAADQRLMIILTGAGISVTIVALAGYMILRSNKEIQQMRKHPNGK